MKIHPIPLITISLLFSLQALTQNDLRYQVFLKSGSFVPKKNVDSISTRQFNLRAPRVNGQTFAVIQFEHLPNDDERQQLLKAGITLLDYIPNNSYTVSIRGAVNEKLLQRVNARAVIQLAPEQKMPQSLASGNAPPWSVKVQGTADVLINFPKNYSFETILSELEKRKFDTTSTLYKDYHIIGLRVPLQRMNELASLPFIVYVQPAPHEDQALNNVTRVDSRANVLNASLSVGGRNLKGDGVVIGVGDDADPQQHVDFTNRLISRTYAPLSASHGIHVTGTAAGAGILNELYKGYAPKATVVTQYFSGIWLNAPGYIQDYGMVITNNSYGAVTGDCSYNGLYDLYSYVLDQEAIAFPYLQNVFAAGNSGLDHCLPYPTGFKTVLGSYQSAKDVLTVGATDSTGAAANFSSKGPVKDGRIKPEITAVGTSVISTGVASYFTDNGTSMASPGVTGGLTLLWQLYRQLNGGSNPKSGLMKAVICNTSRDVGNAGPDYSNGFGWMDLRRAAMSLENNRYLTSNIANGNQNTHTINVPANTAQLKVMLYWQDPPASLLSTQTLVNDLDLTVQTPSSTTVFPKILDTISSHVTNVATEGPDHINNIEQVVINPAQTGSYTINVKGNSVTQNSPQEYFVTYDFVPDSTVLTFPIGGESFSTKDSILIQWDAFGTGSTFKVEYSTDDGASWTSINNSVAGNLRQLKWVMPNVTTDKAKVRITNNTSGAVSTSSDFVILGLPVVTLAAVQCEGYISITWTTIPGATDYEIFMLRGDDMQSVTTTTATNYIFTGLSKDSTYWVAVRARLNGNAGRRSVAVSRKPATGTCTGTISDNDLKMDSVLAPLPGRKFTSTQLGNSVQVMVRIKNLDNVAISNYNVGYSVNNGAWVNDNVLTAVNGGTTATHTFATPFDFSAVGTYTLRAYVAYGSDTVKANDTLTVIVKHLDNQPIDLTTDFLENFDAAPVQQFKTAQTGLTGLDHFDFSNSSVNGRLRNFINTGIAHSGNNAVTLDVDRYIYPSTNTNYLYGTFNLSNYNVNSDDIRLDFFYDNHGQPSGAGNSVWIRGSDTSPWVLAYDLFANQNDPGTYKQTTSIEIAHLLGAAGQTLTSSCQVRWGEFGYLPAADISDAGGYSFDDMHLYKVTDDIQMVSIDTPIVNSCGLSSTTPVKVSVKNSANATISNIPVFFQVDGGAIISENISSIASNTTLQYTFAATADLSAPGTHTVVTWVDYASDSYRANDRDSVSIVNSPVISSFPYLENFEGGNGSWYTGGVNSSWQYGTPASTKINSAASGSKAWKTRLSGNYNDLEFSYLYSPCFDLTGMVHPTVSMSIAFDVEDCGASLCDASWVEYSSNGTTWTKLGAFGQGTNWYNKSYSSNQLWSVQDYTRWHVVTINLPTGISRLRLRVVMNSDQAVNREGVAVDDIHVYDNAFGIYTGTSLTSPVNQNITGGTSWIHFLSGGKLVASVNPNNQNMGSTNAQVYINTVGVRHTITQYYHNRNLTIIPANSLTDSASVRFYFLDSESEALINATGCTSCSKPASAYQLGVSKYSEPANRANEDSTITNDGLGLWLYINSGRVTKVPFDKGYYAEFKVRDFSEFWLNNGGLTGLVVLPLNLISFNAYKQPDNDVLLKWKTSDETNVNRFEIEVARSSRDFQTYSFVKIGSLPARGSSSSEQDYDFTDGEQNKTGVRYYRLKIVDNDGNYRYSEIRPVVFNSDVTWQIYPNPSQGVFNFVFQQNATEQLNLKVYNLKGELVWRTQTSASGFAQKIVVDLQQPRFTPGMYMIVAEGAETRTFKVVKQ